MKAVCSSETSVPTYQITLSYPEDHKTCNEYLDLYRILRHHGMARPLAAGEGDVAVVDNRHGAVLRKGNGCGMTIQSKNTTIFRNVTKGLGLGKRPLSRPWYRWYLYWSWGDTVWRCELNSTNSRIPLRAKNILISWTTISSSSPHSLGRTTEKSVFDSLQG